MTAQTPAALLGPSGSYQVSLTLGRATRTGSTDDYALAASAAAEFMARHADDSDAQAGIYSRADRRTLLNWRGGTRKRPQTPEELMAPICDAMLASGLPVWVSGIATALAGMRRAA